MSEEQARKIVSQSSGGPRPTEVTQDIARLQCAYTHISPNNAEHPIAAVDEIAKDVAGTGAHCSKAAKCNIFSQKDDIRSLHWMQYTFHGFTYIRPLLSSPLRVIIIFMTSLPLRPSTSLIPLSEQALTRPFHTSFALCTHAQLSLAILQFFLAFPSCRELESQSAPTTAQFFLFFFNLAEPFQPPRFFNRHYYIR